MKTPEQEIFDELVKICIELQCDYYYFAPKADAKYPFVQIGATQTVPTATKSRLLSTIYQTIDIWGSKKQRQLVSNLGHTVMEKASMIRVTKSGYTWKMSLSNSTVEIIPDNSSNDNLWRARLSLQWTQA